MLDVFSERTALPSWVIVLALVALSPLPLMLPSGIAVAVIGLMGLALVFRQSGPRTMHSATVPRPCAGR